MRIAFILLAGLLLFSPTELEAQRRCTRGIPCGNTCIAANRTCRVGTGSARAASPSSASARAAAAVPDSTNFVASSRGRVYYWVGCSAWRSLSTANLRYFRTRQEAEASGYTPSRSAGCAGPSESWEGQPTTYQEVPGAVAATAAAGAVGDRCTIEQITDGDTVVCSGERIRLLLIDAPENEQHLSGLQSKLALESLAPIGTEVRVERDVEDRDRYGRLLAYLHLADGRLLNEELVRTGYAVVLVYPPNTLYEDRFRAAERMARDGRYGLWASNAFECLPVDFRAGRCRN